MWNVPGKSYEAAVRRESLMLAEYPEALSVVIWDSESDQPLAVGTSVFVHEKFYKECVESDKPWVVSHAWEQQQAGRSPFLDHQQIKHLNSTSGLHILITTFGIWPNGHWTRGRLFEMLLRKHAEAYEGYHVNVSFAEPTNDELLSHLLWQGYQQVNDYGGKHRIGPNRSPVLVSVDRNRALAGHDYYLCRMFTRQEPICGFTPSQQELLIEAVRGGTDEDIAGRLFISRDTVRQRWAGVYARMEAMEPGLLPSGEDGQRPRERRRVVIEYAREHPPELRPFDPKAAAAYGKRQPRPTPV
jgi:DNA-binding CsgD family transcriptional regulator